MREGEVSIGLNASAQPCRRFGISAKPQFGDTDIHQPTIRIGIAGRPAERFLYMGFRFRASTDEIFAHADERMGVGQIPV